MIEAISTNEYVRSIAHRGYWENTVECLKRATINAKVKGFDVIENDVNMTSDGVYVMWHDESLTKVGYPLLKIKDISYSQLVELDLDGDSFMTFKEWILLCKSLGLGCRVDFKIEITNTVAQDLTSIVKDVGMSEHTEWVGSFVFREYILDCVVILATVPTKTNVESYRQYLSEGLVIFCPHIKNVNSDIVKLAFDNGYGFECWTMEYHLLYGFVFHSDFVTACYDAIQCGVQGICCDNNTVLDIVAEKLEIVRITD